MKNPFLILTFIASSLNFCFAQTQNVEQTATAAATQQIEQNQPKKKKRGKEKTPEPTEAEKTQAMFSSLETGDAETVKTLVNSGKVNYYRHNQEGETALTLAIKQNDLEKVEILVKRAVINQKNKEGETPLTLAIKQSTPDIIDLVVARAKASLKNSKDETPLYLAIAKGNLELVQKLTDKGANLNQKTKGITPTSQATILNDHKMVSFLVKRGANISLANDDKTTPLSLAVKMNHDLIAGMLITKSTQVEKDVNWANKFGEPLINIASKKDNPVLVKMLLDAGAKVSSTDFQDNTPVHVAAANGNVNLLNFLLEQPEISVNIRNATGASPLIVAAADNQQKTYDVLLRKGADASQGDYAGRVAKTHLEEAKHRAANGTIRKNLTDENDQLIEAVAMQTALYR